RIALAAEFRRYRPRVVIGFGDKTPMASPDHWQAMQITDAAVFYSRLSKWDEYFPGLPVHHIDAQLYFRLAFEPATLGGYASHFTVDITETLELKLASVACYETQFPPEKSHVFERIRGAALIAGSAAGVGAGEVFVNTRSLRTSDLMQFLFA
ncbi:MAG: PIG-L deacetylase family protein, partial [Planctomycetota bacterium]